MGYGKGFFARDRRASCRYHPNAFQREIGTRQPCSVPITWDELTEIKQSDRWNITNIHQRLADLAEEPWRDYEKSRQNLHKAIAALEKSSRKGTREK